MGFLAPAIPAIAGVVGGLFGSKKTGGEKALEQAALAREALLQPAGKAAINFYQTLLSGDRNAAMQLLSPSIQNVSAQYDTAKRNIFSTLAPGGVREKALAELEAGKVRDVSNLFSSVQPTAAKALADMYSGNQGTSLYGLGQLAYLGQDRAQQAQKTGMGIGNILSQILFPKKETGGSGGAAAPAPLVGAFGF